MDRHDGHDQHHPSLSGLPYHHDMEMDTADAMDVSTPSLAPAPSPSAATSSSSSSTSAPSPVCSPVNVDLTTATVTPSPSAPSHMPSSPSSTTASPAEAGLARHSALLAQLRRRSQNRYASGRDGTLGASGTWPPQGLFPAAGAPDRDEVEVWLRRQLMEVVRQKSARWGIDFASDPIERIASVVLAEEGITEQLELVPPPQPVPSNLFDASVPTSSAYSQSYSSSSTQSSYTSTTTTPSSDFEHASVSQVQRSAAKRPPR